MAIKVTKPQAVIAVATSDMFKVGAEGELLQNRKR